MLCVVFCLLLHLVLGQPGSEPASYHAIYRRGDIDAPVLVSIEYPAPFSAVTTKDFIVVRVEGMTLGEETGSLVISHRGNIDKDSVVHTSNISISRFFPGGTAVALTMLDLEVSAATFDGELLLSPGSVAQITLFVNDQVTTDVEFPFWGINTTHFKELKESALVVAPSNDDGGNNPPVVQGIKWIYPGESGVDVLTSRGMIVCFNIDINADYVYLMVVPNPTPDERKYFPAIFRVVGSRQQHLPSNPMHCMSLEYPAFMQRIAWGTNSIHVWASGRLDFVDVEASTTFMAVNLGEFPLTRAFATNTMYNFVAKTSSSEVQPIHDDYGREMAEEEKDTVLIIVEIPPRGLNATGDEHAVSVVVGAVMDLGLEFVIVSRICEWSKPTRGEEAEEIDRRNMDENIRQRLYCPVAGEHAGGWISLHRRKWVAAIIMSRVWELPHQRGLPDVWIPTLRSCCSETKIIVWGVDVHAVCNPYEHYLRETQGTFIRQYSQMTSMAWSDAVVAYTREDLEFIEPILPSWVKLFHSSTNHGVTLTGNEIFPGFEARKGILLFGAPHIINVEANLWFLCKVWPIMKKALIDNNILDQVVVTVVGMTSEHAGKYAKKLNFDMEIATSKEIQWLGYVPDLNVTFNSARLCATPILSCPEFCSKNMRALERGVPVVTTPRGAQGYFVEDDRSGKLGVAVAEASPDEFAQVAMRLLTNKEKWEEASHGALQLMMKHFQEKHVRKTFADAIEAVL